MVADGVETRRAQVELEARGLVVVANTMREQAAIMLAADAESDIGAALDAYATFYDLKASALTEAAESLS